MINKDCFECEKNKIPSLFKRIVDICYLWIFVYLIIYISPLNLQDKGVWVIWLLPVVHSYTKLFRIRGRLLTRICFDDDNSFLVIDYIHMVRTEYSIRIPYSNLKSKLGNILMWDTKIYYSKTLRFYESGSNVGEIRIHQNLGWSEKNMEKIHHRIQSLKTFKIVNQS